MITSIKPLQNPNNDSSVENATEGMATDITIRRKRLRLRNETRLATGRGRPEADKTVEIGLKSQN